MPNQDLKHALAAALQAFKNGSLTECALSLFQTLGYNTSRQAPLDSPTYAEFYNSYAADSSRFREDKAFVNQWEYVDLLFQLSAEELRAQLSIFDTTRVDNTIIESYLFFVIGLSENSYTRTALSQITREVNKLFPMPAMILFKHGNTLTLSVIDHRIHKKDEQKDVLEKVTLIKDIQIENTHRAHLEILADLSLPELTSQYTITNYVELHNAWQKTLDTKELNKRFFKDLSNWYFWAMQEVTFPDDMEKNAETRNATNLIRLITRIIFVWFIKEKSLVPDKIFQPTTLKIILKEFCKDDSSHSYYRAILQNLFFGILNQKMDERKFAKDEGFPKNKSEYGVKTLLRYEGLFRFSQEEVLDLFKDVPFLNGGLFDCLDKEDENYKVQYVDGFSRNTKKQAFVPDYLFFGGEHELDLNSIYGTKNKSYKTKGLFAILSNYKFTVTENTPIEEEVALDPELLGKVFENLLASYNPETKTTARKQTGSFYTPREIVNYMVDESLIAYLIHKLEEAGYPDREDALRELLSYTENPNSFNGAETAVLIKAVDDCKILDPACGSGAFPMGILHKLVHILHKLDPQNELWKERQMEKAEAFEDATLREKSISNIEEAFANNELDYGRKLYLIENCIYGVDIQPIAVQIAKLRFFISLIIDQQKQPERENLGIQALPNLETKFVAANTLIPLEKPEDQMSIFTFDNPEIETLKNKLKQIRHRYFNAKTRGDKLRYQKQDKAAREELAQHLINDNWGEHTVQQLVAFDPYDQNASAPFFDPEWMFGLNDGFDIVIGNPPYYLVSDKQEKSKLKTVFKTLHFKINLFACFIEKGVVLAKKDGILSYINPNLLFANDSFKKLREFLCINTSIMFLLNLGDGVFENVTMPTMVFLLKNLHNPKNTFRIYPNVIDKHLTGEFFLSSQEDVLDNFNCVFETTNPKYKKILDTIHSNAVELEEVLEINQGIITGNDKVYLSHKKNNKFWKRTLRGRDVDSYQINYPELYVHYLDSELACPRNKQLFDVDEKIVMRRTGDFPIAALDNQKTYNLHTLYSCRKKSDLSLRFLLSLLNSNVLKFAYQQKLGTESGRIFAEIKILYVRKLPVRYTNYGNKFERVVDYIIFQKNNKAKNVSLFLSLINAMVYELYLNDAVTSAGANLLNELPIFPDIKPLIDKNKNAEIMQIIENIYKVFSNPANPVNAKLKIMKDIPEIKIIEGRD